MKFLFLLLFPVFVLGFFILPLKDPGVKPHINSFFDNPEARIPRSTSASPINIQTKIIASGLDVPWEIAWGPDNRIWITEQKGVVSRVDPQNGTKTVLLKLNDVWFLRTAGLLGMALHPDMKNNPYVFLNYTFLKNEKPFSRLIRYTWQKDTLVNPRILMEIPANNGHSGSRLLISRGMLFWATGDAASTTYAQDFNSPNGKILRLNIDGSVPSDNPVKGSPVWAMGFRNIQGMVFSKSGQLYTSEHGDATDDEVNLIGKARNYGWPAVQGFADNPKEIDFAKSKSGVDPLKAWTPTIGPAGLDYYSNGNITKWNNSLLLVSLKGKNLRSLKLDASGTRILEEEIFFEKEFGRLRDICISPSGDVYISTSNRDWNRTMGDPLPSDDRIIQISHSEKPYSPAGGVSQAPPLAGNLYQQYCASCHKEDGTGLKGVFPPLKGSDLVNQGGVPLITKVLNGSAGQTVIKGTKYDAVMPAFSFLKDEELADILTYVRTMNSLDNSGIDAKSINRARRN